MASMSTDEFLAVKFPHLRKSWLERINRKLGLLWQENGGNAEMHVRWRKCHPDWTEWSIREPLPHKEE